MGNIDFQAVAALAAPEGPLSEQCMLLRQLVARDAQRLSLSVAAASCILSEERHVLLGEARFEAARLMLHFAQLADCMGWSLGDLMAISVEEIRAKDPIRFAAVAHPPYPGG